MEIALITRIVIKSKKLLQGMAMILWLLRLRSFVVERINAVHEIYSFLNILIYVCPYEYLLKNVLE